jgi:hypothetical protein
LDEPVEAPFGVVAELHPETAGGLDAGVGQHADEDYLFDSVLF